MPARHDLKKRHHGRRKLGKKRRHKRWMHRHKKRANRIRSKR